MSLTLIKQYKVVHQFTMSMMYYLYYLSILDVAYSQIEFSEARNPIGVSNKINIISL